MKKIRFAIAQMNPTVGDYAGNTQKILQWIQAAERKGADIIVFPEIALSGYPVWDLANKKSFIREGLESLEKIRKATAKMDITIVLGFIDEGKKDGRSFNSMVWLQKGRIIAKQAKRLLPTYDVFLEQIFFQQAETSRVIPWKGLKIGPTICEDIWDETYETKPLEDLKKQKADLIVNISASPYYCGVAEVRDELLVSHARRYKMPMLYVNQVGGQDDLVFDGRSLFVDETGKILFRAPAFCEDLFYFEWDASPKPLLGIPMAPEAGNPAEIYQALVTGVRDYCRKNRFPTAVIGLSGGIDSALVAAIAVDALGPEAVMGVTMPGEFSSRGSWEDAQDLAKRLGIKIVVRPIKEVYKTFLKEYSNRKQKEEGAGLPANKVTLAMENLQSRLRGLELMFISNDEGRLVLTTGNKSELAMGYCTLYGDMAGGLGVIGDVYKTDVYKLAHYRNSRKEVIPKATLEKAPSAELRPNQTDQDTLPPYDILDQVLYQYIEKNKSADEIAASLRKKTSPQKIEWIVRRVDHNEYKRRQTPPILRVTEKAWFGRRMPITNRFEH